MTDQLRDRIRPPAREPLRVPPELWWFCTADCAVLAGGALFAAWNLPATVSVPEVAFPLAALSFFTWLVVYHVTASGALAGWLLAGGWALAGWFAFARYAGPHTAHVIEAWVILTGLAVLTGPPAIAHSRRLGTRDMDAEERARQKAELEKWERMFRRLHVRDVKITTVYRHSGGRQVHGSLSGATDEHGVITFEQLRLLAPAVDTDQRLKAGATTFEAVPDNAAEFVMHLNERKGKRPVRFLPGDASPATVNEAFAIGVHDNDRAYKLLLREIGVLIAGIIGSGKSNLLQVLIGQLARCEDVLIFVIDLKGGRMARPWVQPWVEGRAERPAVAWLATTRAEANLMLDTLLAAGDARAVRGAGGEKITPRRNRPGIVLIVDETAVATGHNRKDDDVKARELAVKLSRVIETYRSEAFVPVVAAVRSDVETLGMTAFKAQSACRIGMRVSQSGDGDSVFPDDHAAALALSKIRDEGAGLVLLKGRMSSPVHFYRVTPKIAYIRAMATDSIRPGPDPHLEAAMDQVRVQVNEKDRGAWESRWDRMAVVLDAWRQGAHEWRHDRDVGIGDVPDLAPARRKAATAVMDREPPVPAAGGAGGDDDLHAQFEGIIAQVEDLDPDGKVHPARRRMRELLFRRGAAGYTVGNLVKIIGSEPCPPGIKPKDWPPHRNTFQKWLKADEELGRVRSKARSLNDPYARWAWNRQAGDEDLLAPDDRPGDYTEDEEG